MEICHGGGSGCWEVNKPKWSPSRIVAFRLILEEELPLAWARLSFVLCHPRPNVVLEVGLQKDGRGSLEGV